MSQGVVYICRCGGNGMWTIWEWGACRCGGVKGCCLSGNGVFVGRYWGQKMRSVLEWSVCECVYVWWGIWGCDPSESRVYVGVVSDEACQLFTFLVSHARNVPNIRSNPLYPLMTASQIR